MHRLRHPVTVFIVTVIAVIGVGVGVVAATTNQQVYGPSWGRFSVAFMGRPTVTFVGHSSELEPHSTPVWVMQSGPGRLHDFMSSGVNPPGGEAITVLGDVFRPAGSSAIEALFARADALSGPVYFPRPANANSYSVFEPFPSGCSAHWCSGAMWVSRGGVVWMLRIVTKRPLSQVEAFLDSFQPIG